MESGVNESGNYFTTLLELPSNQAMQLLTDDPPQPEENRLDITANFGGEFIKRHRVSACNHTLHSNSLPAFPSNSELVSRAAMFSVFAKPEPVDSGSDPGLSDPASPLKRKDRGNKGKCSNKKSKTMPKTEDGEMLPYVHVRARRGQATDSHSLAERARREKINARMKFLQDLVPGCNKISGTALVLEEIINHVQYLQRQVEYLSMRLAAVSPRIDFNHNSLNWTGAESMMDASFPNLTWPEFQMNGDRQPFQQQCHFESLSQPVWMKDENHRNLVSSENSLLSYDSPANSASLHSSHLKMEL